MFCKKNVLKISQNTLRETPLLECFFIKVASLTLLRNTPVQVIFCQFRNILNDTYFVKQMRPASENSQNHKVSDAML